VSPSPQGSHSPCILRDTTRPRHITYVQVWSKSDQRRLRKTLHSRQTDTTKIMVTCREPINPLAYRQRIGNQCCWMRAGVVWSWNRSSNTNRAAVLCNGVELTAEGLLAPSCSSRAGKWLPYQVCRACFFFLSLLTYYFRQHSTDLKNQLKIRLVFQI